MSETLYIRNLPTGLEFSVLDIENKIIQKYTEHFGKLQRSDRFIFKNFNDSINNKIHNLGVKSKYAIDSYLQENNIELLFNNDWYVSQSVIGVFTSDNIVEFKEHYFNKGDVISVKGNHFLLKKSLNVFENKFEGQFLMHGLEVELNTEYLFSFVSNYITIPKEVTNTEVFDMFRSATEYLINRFNKTGNILK